MNVLVFVLTSTRNQCALSNSGMRVVLCVLITFLTSFWCLGMSVRGMKYESWHSRRVVFSGSRGRMRRMRISSMAADEMCACSLSDWMAWACGVRVRAIAAVLYCAAVGCVDKCRIWYSVVVGCCVWRRLFLGFVVVFCFFCGSAFWLSLLHLYMMAC